MWIVTYNGITGMYYCEPYDVFIADMLAHMDTVPNDSWFII